MSDSPKPIEDKFTTRLKAVLDELAVKHNVPGAAVAVLDGDDLIEAATGVVNLNTGVEATTDTLFQIGSITKVWTATLIMQLVDQAKIELDAPVRSYLPEFKLADPEATEVVTVRQLLCHTSGMDGDRFEDTGRGDDCVKEYVTACVSLPQVASPGRLFSYCNAGFVVAGRLIEEVTGRVWDVAVRERLVEPLELRRTVTLPEEALLHRAAVGHVDPTNSGDLIPAPVWAFPRAVGPAGLICSTAAEVIAFVRMHLEGGAAQNGMRVLSPESVSAMQEQQVELLDRYTHGTGWGLGWTLYDWDGLSLIGHDGGTLGQLAFLRVVPKSHFALCLLTNGLTGRNLFKELVKEVFAERFDIAVPEFPKASESVIDFDPDLYAGVYQRENQRTTIEIEDGGLVATIEFSGPLASVLPAVEKIRLKPINKTEFLFRVPGMNDDAAVVFFDFNDTGRPRYMHSGGRATPRVG